MQEIVAFQDALPSFVKAGTARPRFLISFVSPIVNPSITVLISLGYIGSWGFHNINGILGRFLAL